MKVPAQRAAVPCKLPSLLLHSCEFIVEHCIEAAIPDSDITSPRSAIHTFLSSDTHLEMYLVFQKSICRISRNFVAALIKRNISQSTRLPHQCSISGTTARKREKSNVARDVQEIPNTGIPQGVVELDITENKKHVAGMCGHMDARLDERH